MSRWTDQDDQVLYRNHDSGGVFRRTERRGTGLPHGEKTRSREVRVLPEDILFVTSWVV